MKSKVPQLSQYKQDEYKEIAFGNQPIMKDMAKDRLDQARGASEWNRVSDVYRDNYDQIRWEC
jgi:hypothetical protein